MTAAIFVAIGGTLAVSLLMNQRAFVTSEAYTYVQQQARRALDAMVKELREAGDIDSPTTTQDQDFTSAARLNFRIARNYDEVACGGICWGNDTTTLGWVHYLLDTTDAQHARLLRCQSTPADGSDAGITDFSGCRTLSNDVQTFQVDYADSAKTVTIRLENRLSSQQIATGGLSTTPSPLRTQVRLRNP
ncbi:MAG: hypothetical protein HY595_03860 [Candidatus Omnitrophica bacterium]|nr:hypothetical protein [Candidatus Omnitrophota bacterium]